MSKDIKKNILFIKDENSQFDSQSQAFNELFAKVDKVVGEQKALKLIYNNHYDIIVSDLSVNPVDGTIFMKQIKEMRPEQEIVTLMLTEDEDKLGDLIEFGVHAFVLTSEQLEQALETIAQMNSTEKK